jgi:uncharacterized protein (TIGR03435 family)
MGFWKVVIGTVLLAIAIGAQPQGDEKDRLSFEVASVKPSAPGGLGGIIRAMPGNQRYHGENMPLLTMMTVAYSVTNRQIAGGPDWMATDRFDIEAKASRPRSIAELDVMLQHLLEDRFQLKLRREKREEAAYLLTVGKGGPKMPVHDAGDNDFPPIGGKTVTANDGSICPGLAGRNVTMGYFAFVLSRMMDRQVLDRTALPARYDVVLNFVPDDMRLRGAPDGGTRTFTPDCGDIYSALPAQLGLRLEKGRGPVEYLVVERAERPARN